jgi:hypothetical protein
VVDAQVGRHRGVARIAVAALPLDQSGSPAAQPVGRGQEGPTVVPGRQEVVAVGAVVVGGPQPGPGEVVDVAQLVGPVRGEGVGERVAAEHRQPGDDLGDLGLQRGHGADPAALRHGHP